MSVMYLLKTKHLKMQNYWVFLWVAKCTYEPCFAHTLFVIGGMHENYFMRFLMMKYTYHTKTHWIIFGF